jgi:hypothetical protein
VQTINVNGTTTNLSSPKKQNRNIGAIVGGSIGGVAAIFAVIGIVTFVQRRRRWRRSGPRSILSTDSVDAGPQIIVTPFDPDSFYENRYSGISAEQQHLVTGDPEAEIPVGLSDKEIARLRTEAVSSPQPHNFRISALNMSQSTSPLNPVTEFGEPPYRDDTRRLHSEFESLRREVERLREEGFVVTAPPSYAEGDG